MLVIIYIYQFKILIVKNNYLLNKLIYICIYIYLLTINILEKIFKNR